MTDATRKIRKKRLPSCVSRAGNNTFETLNMLWDIKATKMLPPVLLYNQMISIVTSMDAF
jgi:hypothetical protein